jgi:hypothetical protein
MKVLLINEGGAKRRLHLFGFCYIAENRDKILI